MKRGGVKKKLFLGAEKESPVWLVIEFYFLCLITAESCPTCQLVSHLLSFTRYNCQIVSWKEPDKGLLVELEAREEENEPRMKAYSDANAELI